MKSCNLRHGFQETTLFLLNVRYGGQTTLQSRHGRVDKSLTAQVLVMQSAVGNRGVFESWS